MNKVFIISGSIHSSISNSYYWLSDLYDIKLPTLYNDNNFQFNYDEWDDFLNKITSDHDLLEYSVNRAYDITSKTNSVSFVNSQLLAHLEKDNLV